MRLFIILLNYKNSATTSVLRSVNVFAEDFNLTLSGRLQNLHFSQCHDTKPCLGRSFGGIQFSCLLSSHLEHEISRSSSLKDFLHILHDLFNFFDRIERIESCIFKALRLNAISSGAMSFEALRTKFEPLMYASNIDFEGRDLLDLKQSIAVRITIRP